MEDLGDQSSYQKDAEDNDIDGMVKVGNYYYLLYLKSVEQESVKEKEDKKKDKKKIKRMENINLSTSLLWLSRAEEEKKDDEENILMIEYLYLVNGKIGNYCQTAKYYHQLCRLISTLISENKDNEDSKVKLPKLMKLMKLYKSYYSILVENDCYCQDCGMKKLPDYTGIETCLRLSIDIFDSNLNSDVNNVSGEGKEV
jgi:hypothetical protein